MLDGLLVIDRNVQGTVKPVFKTTCEIGTTWILGPDTLISSPIHHMEIDLGNKTTSEFRTAFHRPSCGPNSQAPLYFD